jgi:hypothetical protein
LAGDPEFAGDVSDRAFIDPDAGDQQDPAVIVQASVSVHDGRPLVARWTASDTTHPARGAFPVQAATPSATVTNLVAEYT